MSQMLDHFTLVSPNGAHDCLILEMLGPSVADVVDSYCEDGRLPGRLAKSFASQVLQGLDFLVRYGIAHGVKAVRHMPSP